MSVVEEVEEEMTLAEKKAELAECARYYFKEYELDDWTLRYNPRLTSRLGQCDERKQVIELGEQFVELNDFDLVYDTLKHELAHAICTTIPTAMFEKPHGPCWKANAKRLGVDPRASCNDPRLVMPPPKPRKPRRQWVGVCLTCGAARTRTRRRGIKSCGKCSPGVYNEEHRLVWVES